MVSLSLHVSSGKVNFNCDFFLLEHSAVGELDFHYFIIEWKNIAAFFASQFCAFRVPADAVI